MLHFKKVKTNFTNNYLPWNCNTFVSLLYIIYFFVIWQENGVVLSQKPETYFNTYNSSCNITKYVFFQTILVFNIMKTEQQTTTVEVLLTSISPGAVLVMGVGF